MNCKVAEKLCVVCMYVNICFFFHWEGGGALEFEGVAIYFEMSAHMQQFTNGNQKPILYLVLFL